MGKYPVVNLTLKSAKQSTFESAYYKFKEEIAEEFGRHHAFPRPYWINTSSNEIIKDMVGRADREMRVQLEMLLDGKTMDIPIHEEITYVDMYESGENLWNFLYFTGYLTKAEEI